MILTSPRPAQRLLAALLLPGSLPMLASHDLTVMQGTARLVLDQVYMI